MRLESSSGGVEFSHEATERAQERKLTRYLPTGLKTGNLKTKGKLHFAQRVKRLFAAHFR